MTKTCVYLIGDHVDACKIGIASNVKNRLGQMRTHNIASLSIFGTWWFGTGNEARQVERYLHAALRKHRVRGEWFRIKPDDALELIDRLIVDGGITPLKTFRRRQPSKATPKKIFFLRLVCPGCGHKSRSDLTAKEIWRSRFKCSACGSAVLGRQVLKAVSSA